MGIIIVGVLVRTQSIGMPGEHYLRDDGKGRELRAAHYANVRREHESLLGQPYIASEVVRGPTCAFLWPIFRAGQMRPLRAIARRSSTRRSLSLAKHPLPPRSQVPTRCSNARPSAWHPVTLDSEPLTDLRYDVAKDARTGLRGFVAMVDVRALTPGRHELRVSQPGTSTASPTRGPMDHPILTLSDFFGSAGLSRFL